MIDIHSHILPAVDDGPRDVDISLELIEMIKMQGITDIIATPHFLPMKDNMDGFLKRREDSLNFLLSKTKGDIPNIYLGAEVYYFRGIGKSEELKKLTLHNSKYLLIEIPYERITDSLIEDLKDIYCCLGLVPIIAHIERYSRQGGFGKLLKFCKDNENCMIQINAVSLLSRPYKNLCKRMIKKGYVDFIATDTHSVVSRPPKLREAMDAVREWFGKEETDKLYEKMKLIKDSISKE